MPVSSEVVGTGALVVSSVVSASRRAASLRRSKISVSVPVSVGGGNNVASVVAVGTAVRLVFLVFGKVSVEKLSSGDSVAVGNPNGSATPSEVRVGNLNALRAGRVVVVVIVGRAVGALPRFGNINGKTGTCTTNPGRPSNNAF